MALPYPDGEVYFDKSALHRSFDGGWNAAKEKDFYGIALVETVWNSWVLSGGDLNTSNLPWNGRTDFIKVNPQWWGTNYGIFTHQKFTFSNDASGQDRDNLRGVSLQNNTNANELRDNEDGGPDKVIVMPVTLGEEKYMFMDLTAPVCAIYFPLA